MDSISLTPVIKERFDTIHSSIQMEDVGHIIFPFFQMPGDLYCLLFANNPRISMNSSIHGKQSHVIYQNISSIYKNLVFAFFMCYQFDLFFMTPEQNNMKIHEK